MSHNFKVLNALSDFLFIFETLGSFFDFPIVCQCIFLSCFRNGKHESSLT